jgi:phosphonate transport system substrate-binding protein
MKMKNLLFAMLIFSLPFSVTSETTYSFGIVPQQSSAKLAELWLPILKEISQKTGLSIQFATAPDIPTFEKRVAAGEYDFAYMNPYHFTVFNEKPGYQAVAKAKDKLIKGIIVVKKDSDINSLQQLNDHDIAFPAPKAFAASMLTRSHLVSRNTNFIPKYVASHDSVYLSVARGIYIAGGGVMRTFNSTDPSIKEQLRVLWTTKGFTPHAIAAHPRIPNEISNNLQQALMSLSNTTLGLELLDKIKIKGFVAAENNDWNDVRALKVD